jgi:hypothetical protein
MTLRPRLASALVAFVLLAACSDGGDGGDGGEAASTTTSTAAGPTSIDAQLASYDLVTGRPQRLLVGLVASGGRLVSGGEVQVFFAHLGDGQRPQGTSATGTLGEPHRAVFKPITGSDAPKDGPRLTRPSEGVGVYVIDAATFDRPGRWGLIAKVDFGSAETTAQGTFDVAETSRIPSPGAVAPVTDNPLPGAPGIRSEAIDSRLRAGEDLPDPELHATTIAAARAAGRPLVVVVSTPVYCVSRFCGPITDSVATLASSFGDRAAFVHLEVWQDFEKKQVNEFIADWIYPDRKGDLLEPWVFVVDRDGRITHRFDNIATDEELRAAVEQVTS